MTTLRRSERLRLKHRKPVPSVPKRSTKSSPTLPLRRSQRLANKKLKKARASRVKVTFELRRSQRLAEKRLRNAQGQLPDNLQSAISDPIRLNKPESSPIIPASISMWGRLLPTCRCPSCSRLRQGINNSTPAAATEVKIQTPHLLVHMEKNCSDAEWLWMRWNGVPSENRVLWEHVHARRGKFLQLAFANRDVALVKAVYEISQSPAHRDNEKWRFVDAVHYAVEYQLFELLPWLNEIEQATGVYKASQPATSMLMNMALCGGDLRIAQWLFENRPSVRDELILESTKQTLGRHSLELLQWVIAHYSVVFSSAPASQQQLARLESILSQIRGENVLCSAGDEAVACGNVSVVQFLHENRLETNFSKQALSVAAAHNHLEVLQFLHDQGVGEWTTDVMDKAAAHGNLAIVVFLHANRSEGCTQQAMDRAARNGHTRVLEFLHCERSEGFSANAIADAAANGHFKIVEFLNTQYKHYYSSVLCRAMNEAARYNRLDVLELLFETHQRTSNVDHSVINTLTQQAALRKSDAVAQFLAANISLPQHEPQLRTVSTAI